MDYDTRMAVQEIVNYLYVDEQKDFEASGKPKQHIFRDIRLVANWLEDNK